MTQEQAQALLAAEFDYCVTEAEEAVLDRLEQEWLTMCRANKLEDFDFWTVTAAPQGTGIGSTT